MKNRNRKKLGLNSLYDLNFTFGLKDYLEKINFKILLFKYFYIFTYYFYYLIITYYLFYTYYLILLPI